MRREPDRHAHSAAFLAVAWCRTARRLLGEIAPTVTDTLLGLAALRLALESAERLGELDHVSDADRPRAAEPRPGLGGRLRFARNEILHLAPKIGEPGRHMSVTKRANDHPDGFWTYLGSSGPECKIDPDPVSVTQRECLELLDLLEPWAMHHADRLTSPAE
jgi:hypothetical protein